jgi:mxaK protein
MAHHLKNWFIHQLGQAFPWMLLVWLLSLTGLIWSGNALTQANQYHQHLQNNSIQNSATDDAIFANALYLANHHQTEKALKLYAQATSSPNLHIRKNANYNMANLYLREANKLLDASGFDAWDKVTPLLAIAKEGYREALRLDPNWINAKYNYELALRIAPTIESATSRQKEDDELKNQETVPEGWPAIPGFPRGMP